MRREAEANGARLGDFTRALTGLNPVDWCDRVHPAIRFAVGTFDRYVPRVRRRTLLARAAETVPRDNIVVEPLGHLGVMALSRWRQRPWQRAA